ncbi:hypothetical protein KY314_00250 [Candidatus Woesearchaeota archaeon]|nr:hypothetical protein [Candidatus Woesearchaeota archaeon]
MEKGEILKKTIKKAIKNGWKKGERFLEDWWDETNSFERIIYWKAYYHLIFSHDFAKAFWGEEKVDEFGYKFEDMSDREIQSSYPKGFIYKAGETLYKQRNYDDAQQSWKFHLQQMVISEDPLKYLEHFLN